MQGDLLLQEWKQAKDTCKKIIEICKRSHLGTGEVEGRILGPGEKQTKKQFINVYEYLLPDSALSTVCASPRKKKKTGCSWSTGTTKTSSKLLSSRWPLFSTTKRTSTASEPSGNFGKPTPTCRED